MGKGFDTPAYKLTIKDLTRAKYTVESNTWELTLNTREIGVNSVNKSVNLTLNMFWLQGQITNRSQLRLLLKDSSGVACIEEYYGVPGADEENIQIGSYVGVLGALINNDSTVRVKPVKMMNLDSNPLLAKIWDLEVKKLKAFLLGLIVSEL